MARALALAERGRGLTSPNPMVGAVLVRDGEMVGEGFHAAAGGPHAEVVALAAAGSGRAAPLSTSRWSRAITRPDTALHPGHPDAGVRA